MSKQHNISDTIFDSNISFEQKAFEVAQYQIQYLPLMQQFSASLNRKVTSNTALKDYPFLPVDLFRDHTILTKDQTAEKTFESSGTTGAITSRHPVSDLKIYENSILDGFQSFYGSPSDYIFYGLLPSYLDRENASLIYMVNFLMSKSNHENNKFYRFNYKELLSDISNYKGERKKLVIGVTFALWEMAEQLNLPDLSDVIFMETGGMKGRRKEILREELHQILTNAYRVPKIHSEYGMTEMLSQAYSDGDGIFRCSSTMKVFVRDPYDPLVIKSKGRGVLNVIDLANLHSCSFIATNDLGEIFEDGSFKVLGRIDNSAIRGCNLMFQ